MGLRCLRECVCRRRFSWSVFVKWRASDRPRWRRLSAPRSCVYAAGHKESESYLPHLVEHHAFVAVSRISTARARRRSFESGPKQGVSESATLGSGRFFPVNCGLRTVARDVLNPTRGSFTSVSPVKSKRERRATARLPRDFDTCSLFSETYHSDRQRFGFVTLRVDTSWQRTPSPSCVRLNTSHFLSFHAPTPQRSSAASFCSLKQGCLSEGSRSASRLPAASSFTLSISPFLILVQLEHCSSGSRIRCGQAFSFVRGSHRKLRIFFRAHMRAS